MTDQHLARDSELLAQAVRGELGRDDTGLREVLQRRPAWTDILDELADGTDEGAPGELRALARAQATPADRERMRALVARVVAAAAGGARVRRSWRLPVLLAAVLVAVTSLVWWARHEPPGPPRGPLLGSGAVSWIAPADTVGSWDTFAWEADLPRRGTYTLSVRSGDAQGALLARVEGLREPHWSPGPAEASAWPDSIMVTVEVLQASGIVQASLDVALRRPKR